MLTKLVMLGTGPSNPFLSNRLPEPENVSKIMIKTTENLVLVEKAECHRSEDTYSTWSELTFPISGGIGPVN
jgi:hypothetical protein